MDGHAESACWTWAGSQVVGNPMPVSRLAIQTHRIACQKKSLGKPPIFSVKDQKKKGVKSVNFRVVLPRQPSVGWNEGVWMRRFASSSPPFHDKTKRNRMQPSSLGRGAGTVTVACGSCLRSHCFGLCSALRHGRVLPILRVGLPQTLVFWPLWPLWPHSHTHTGVPWRSVPTRLGSPRPAEGIQTSGWLI